MIRNYYEDELRYLYQAGKEFAGAHPGIARYLHIDSESKEDRDPYVERLFEGFAFLTGRIRERLDDELPEVAESLCGMLWPHLLKPVPSLSILEFKPRPGLVQQTTTFPAGTEVRSVPAGDEAAVCRFRTAHEVRLHPMRLAEAALAWLPGGKTTVTIRFVLEKGIDYRQLQLNPLRLCFHAEESVASAMHLFFTRHVSSVVFSSGDARTELPGAEAIRPAGLGPEEGLLPYSGYSSGGLRLLHEYFSFRRRYWFVDLYGFDRFSPPAKAAEFQVTCRLDRAYPEEKRFTADNLRLHCVPIVNLFGTDAVPVRMDHLSSEYRVIPDIDRPLSSEVYSVDAVVGTEEGTGKQHRYDPLFSFQGTEVGTGERYFTTRTRLGPADRYQTSIILDGFGGGEGAAMPVEVLSLEITASNGSLPREKLQERTITRQAPDFPNVATFENLTQPTLDLHPKGFASLRSAPREENFLWKMVSHHSLNFMSIATPEALRAVLELYDWTGSEPHRRRIAGIRGVRWEPKERIYRSAVMRGVEVTLEIQDGHFADEGDLCLFGLVMSEFFSTYASINSFVQLVIVTKPSEQHLRWGPLKGGLPVL
jgi:type VI secretion system protein ImpG